jgi:hypothetical protein
VGFTLIDKPNPYGPHYYPTRLRPLLAVVMHITAGLEDLDTIDDHSAENTANYAGTTDRDVSWHSGSDTDSWVSLLPATYTAWHVLNYNSPTYGHEISKKHTDWRVMSVEWVRKTLRNAAIGPDGKSGLKAIALKYGIPLRKATKAELDREIANYDAGRPWKPVGFIGHTELQRQDRLDPGLVGSVDTFPWNEFFGYMHDAPGVEKEDDEVSYMVKPNNTARRDVYVVTSTADGIWKRHITESEMNFRLDCGDEVKLVNEGFIDGVQTRSITGESVHNYMVPNGEGGFTEFYKVTDTINRHTTPTDSPSPSGV